MYYGAPPWVIAPKWRVGLGFVYCPSRIRQLLPYGVSGAASFPSTTPLQSGGPYGPVRSFDRSSVMPISTGVVGGVLRHSGLLLLRHTNLSTTDGGRETYFSGRPNSNGSFVFNSSAAFGSAPDRRFQLEFTVGGVAAYQSTVQITGFDNQYLTVGFAHRSSGTVEFYANGAFLDSKVTGTVSALAQDVYIGHDATNFFPEWRANYELAFAAYWDKRLLTRADFSELGTNLTDVFKVFAQRDAYIFKPPTAAFSPAWAMSANSVIQPGAMAA